MTDERFLVLRVVNGYIVFPNEFMVATESRRRFMEYLWNRIHQRLNAT